jgi:hypothetical protein
LLPPATQDSSLEARLRSRAQLRATASDTIRHVLPARPAPAAASLVNLGNVAFGAGRFFDTLGIEATIGAAAAGVAAGFAVLLAAERRPAAIQGSFGRAGGTKAGLRSFREL